MKIYTWVFFCNRHQHGNVSSYFINIKERIGENRFDKLLKERINLKSTLSMK